MTTICKTWCAIIVVIVMGTHSCGRGEGGKERNGEGERLISTRCSWEGGKVHNVKGECVLGDRCIKPTISPCML